MTKQYRVLNPIGWSGRHERGELLVMDEAEATNIGLDYLEDTTRESVTDSVPEPEPVEEVKPEPVAEAPAEEAPVVDQPEA